MPSVTFIREFECRLLADDNDPAPRAVITYPAGPTKGSIPRHHLEAAIKAGAVIDGKRSEALESPSDTDSEGGESKGSGGTAKAGGAGI